MTKSELIKALDGLPDDTVIYVPSIEVAGDELPALYVQVYDNGNNGSVAEVTILGDEE